MNAKAPYSAKVISFQAKPKKLGFAQASEVWVRWCCVDSGLSPAERNFVTSLATYFNASQYKETRELVAWPAWETLISKWSLSRTTIWRAQQKLEHQGKLKVTHGRFNPSTGHKLGNKYRAFPPPPGFSLKRSQVSNTRFQPETRLDDRGLDESRDSTTPVSKNELLAGIEEFDDCLPKGPSGPEVSKQAKEKSGPSSLKTEESQRRSAAPSDSILAQPLSPHPPSSARPPSSPPKAIESGLTAALGRLGDGVRAATAALPLGQATWPVWVGDNGIDEGADEEKVE